MESVHPDMKIRLTRRGKTLRTIQTNPSNIEEQCSGMDFTGSCCRTTAHTTPDHHNMLEARHLDGKCSSRNESDIDKKKENLPNNTKQTSKF
eukprot:10767684-Heterocapsa_arctica.AAC.1